MPWLWGRFKDFLREDDAWLSTALSIGGTLLSLKSAKDSRDAGENAAAAARAEATYNVSAANIAIQNLKREIATSKLRKQDLANRVAFTESLAGYARGKADFEIDALRDRAAFSIETRGLEADAQRGGALANAAARGVQVGSGSAADIQSSIGYLEARDVSNIEHTTADAINAREYDASFEIKSRQLEASEQRTALQSFNDQVAAANLEIKDLSNRKKLFKKQGELGARAASLQGTSGAITALGQAFQHGANAYNAFQSMGKH